ncbi:TPA: helix-turn-helix domain-containing protein [Neisseria bacilliformis]|uniref:helix-turn-helix domain-containing protein n=1 Tax=Neisseria TaxID=482 RepID=UPI0009E62EF9
MAAPHTLRQLLRYTALPITTIADQLGFADAETFRKFFQKHAGITATGFRKK